MGWIAHGIWSVVGDSSRLIGFSYSRRGRISYESPQTTLARRQEQDRKDSAKRRYRISVLYEYRYPFGGYEKDMQMSLREAYRFVSTIREDDEDYARKAARNFILNCMKDDHDFFLDIFCKNPDLWIKLIKQDYDSIKAFVGNLRAYRPFGVETPNVIDYYYVLLILQNFHFAGFAELRRRAEEFIHQLDLKIASDQVRLARYLVTALDATREVWIPLKKEEVLRILLRERRSARKIRQPLVAISELVQISTLYKTYCWDFADDMIRKAIRAIAYASARKAVGIQAVEEIEKVSGLKLPLQYKRDAAQRKRDHIIRDTSRQLDSLQRTTISRIYDVKRRLIPS